MATPAERVDELLQLLQEVDLSTLLALDHKLHVLLKQKGADQSRQTQIAITQKEFGSRYPNLTIDPDLLALVGIHHENLIADDKALIRETIFRRLAE